MSDKSKNDKKEDKKDIVKAPPTSSANSFLAQHNMSTLAALAEQKKAIEEEKAKPRPNLDTKVVKPKLISTSSARPFVNYLFSI